MNVTATAKNTIITFSSLFIPTPIIITNVGVADFFTTEATDAVGYEVGQDNNVITYGKAFKIQGEMTLAPNSTSINAVANILKIQETIGEAILGKLTLTNPIGIWQTIYPEFVFTSAWQGVNLGERVKDVSVKFSCLAPQSFSLGNMVGIASAISGLI